MKMRILVTICCMLFSLMASAQASGGQIRRVHPNKLSNKVTPLQKTMPHIQVISEKEKTCELIYDNVHLKPCIDASTKGVYAIPTKIGKYIVIRIGDRAFSGCKNLTSVIIPNTIVSIGTQAFESCTGLENVSLSEGLESIERYAFWQCENLRNIVIPNSVNHIGACALDFDNFISSKGRKWYDSYPDGMIYIGKIAYKWKGEMSSGIEVRIKEGTLGIAGNAFKGCRELSAIVLPNSLKTIGESAFDGSGLKFVKIPKNLVRIDFRAFADCNIKEMQSDLEKPFLLKEPSYFGRYNERAILYVPIGSRDLYIKNGWDKFTSSIIER